MSHAVSLAARSLLLSLVSVALAAGCGAPGEAGEDEAALDRAAPLAAEQAPAPDCAHEALAAPGTAALAAGAPLTAGVITPVIFVPTDRTVSSAEIAAVTAGLDDLQVWYRRELVNAHLRLGAVQVVHGERPSADYRLDDGIWSRGPAEIERALGYGPWTPGHAVLVVGAGLLGWAGGSSSADRQSGFAAIGLESLTRPAECQGEWWCTPTVWRGTAIHELGHALGLPHSVLPSVMRDHTDYLNRFLLDDDAFPERAAVRASIFAQHDGDVPLSCDRTSFPTSLWHACLFVGRDASARFVRAGTWPTLDRDFGAGGPQAVAPDNFSYEFRRTLQLDPGYYVFETLSDDGIQVDIGADGSPEIDRWNDHAAAVDRTAPRWLAGDVPVVVRYYENAGQAVLRLTWQRVQPGGSCGCVPTKTVACPDGTEVLCPDSDAP